MFRRVCVLVLMAAPSAFAASKEIQELQRDVAQLQDMVKQLQQSQDKQLAALTTLVQQSVDAANRANTAVAVIQSSLQQNLNQQESKVVAPVVGLTTRMDQVSGDVRTLQQAIADLTSSINKIQAQLTDLNNAVKVMQAPAAPPPGAGTPGGVGPVGATGGVQSLPPMTANDLYNAAGSDRTSGKLDLALQEYNDYLKYYGNTDLAPNAQFYIGWIHYSQGAYDTAAADFDAVLERYPDNNNKASDALYYKGLCLKRSGKRTQSIPEFQEVIKRFPHTDNAAKACAELTDMGMHCPSTAAKSTPKSTAQRRKDQ
jgi:TolA-binding protein